MTEKGLHLHNIKLRDHPSQSRVGSSGGVDAGREGVAYQSRFGFDVPTCCGYLPQNNDWCNDWQAFFARKLEEQLNKLQSKGRSGHEALQLWPALQRVIPGLFDGLTVLPSLLHGDLWGGNVAQIDEDGGMKPCIFDPASFYGHHEYDLAIAGMFGGFGKTFWSAYFDKIPKEDGWDRRHELYQLFHYLNHWNHFGSGYADNSLRIMKKLTKWGVNWYYHSFVNIYFQQFVLLT